MNDKEFKELYESSFEYGKEIVHPIIDILEKVGSVDFPKISGFSTSFDFEKNEIHITISLEKAKTLMEKQRDYWREVIEKNDFAKEVTELINKIGVAEFTAKGGKKPTPCGKKEGDKSSSTSHSDKLV